jgi:hypothetical protein
MTPMTTLNLQFFFLFLEEFLYKLMTKNEKNDSEISDESYIDARNIKNHHASILDWGTKNRHRPSSIFTFKQANATLLPSATRSIMIIKI